MVLDPVAPWAEPVLYTADDLFAMPDDGWCYELVYGRLVREPPAGFDHGATGHDLARVIGNFVHDRRLGKVTAAESGFLLSETDEPDLVLAPDLAFVATQRLPAPGSHEAKAYPRLAPDLVVEVASPDQTRPAMAAKARLWTGAGVPLVWVVWPSRRTIDVWHPEDDEPRALREGDSLDGEDILPDFRHAVADVFA
jgi:Uma2 family endonuclease